MARLLPALALSVLALCGCSSKSMTPPAVAPEPTSAAAESGPPIALPRVIDSRELERLRRLLEDYGDDDRRPSDMLGQIDSLLWPALGEVAGPGATVEAVRAALGRPHVRIGDEADDTFAWLYPCMRPTTEPAGGLKWYAVLRFRDGAVVSVERRAWILD